MRGADHVRQTEEDVLFRRFLGIDIESRAFQGAGFQRLGHGVFIHQTATGAVDEVGTLLHLGDAFGIQQIGGFLGFRQVQGDEIGLRQQVLDIVHLGDSDFLRALLGQEGVIGHDLHFQPLRTVGDDRTDVARADQAERLAGDLGPHELRFLPFTGLRGGIGGRNLARHGKHHGNGVFGGGDRVAERRVHHHDPLGRGRGQVHVIHPDTGAPDDLQVIGLGNQIGGRLGGGTDGQTIVIANDFRQFGGVLAQIGLEIDFDSVVFEDFNGSGGQFVRDKNFGHLYAP